MIQVKIIYSLNAGHKILNKDVQIALGDGRHRFAALRELANKKSPVDCMEMGLVVTCDNAHWTGYDATRDCLV